MASHTLTLSHVFLQIKSDETQDKLDQWLVFNKFFAYYLRKIYRSHSFLEAFLLQNIKH